MPDDEDAAGADGDDALVGPDLAEPELGDPELGDQLDLHTFRPRDCADVVEEYVRAAAEAGMTLVRIIHGKGTGTLREIVHGVLRRHPDVVGFRLGGDGGGQWGATVVELKPR